MRLFWIVLLLLGAASSAGPSAGAQAKGVGDGPARMLLAFEGGAGRAVALNLAERTSATTGRAMYVEERPGASGRIAAMALKNAAPDGSTIALLPIAVPVLVPMIFREVNYDAIHDFAPVSQIATYTFAFAVPYDHPARSIPEFVAWLKAHPSRAFYGSPGAGSLAHFLGVMTSRAIGVEMTHVPYKGSGPMSIDLAQDVVPAGIAPVADLIEMHRAGKLRIIATSGATRVAQLAEVPTFAEQGYPEVQATGWVGIFAPAGTPQRTIDEWSAAFVKAVRSPETSSRIIELGVEPTGTTPEELGAIVAADIARWGPIIKLSGFHAD